MIATGRHVEAHRAARIGWLRAAVLGANGGIVSIASLGSQVIYDDDSHAQVGW